MGLTLFPRSQNSASPARFSTHYFFSQVVSGPSGGMGPSDTTCLPLPVHTGTLAAGCSGILMAPVGLGCGADPHLLLGCHHITSSAPFCACAMAASPPLTFGPAERQPSTLRAGLCHHAATIPHGDILGVMKVTKASLRSGPSGCT